MLGSGAGGGVPQWNCGCRRLSRGPARATGARRQRHAGRRGRLGGRIETWLLVGASPDLRQQIADVPAAASAVRPDATRPMLRRRAGQRGRGRDRGPARAAGRRRPSRCSRAPPPAGRCSATIRSSACSIRASCRRIAGRSRHADGLRLRPDPDPAADARGRCPLYQEEPRRAARARAGGDVTPPGSTRGMGAAVIVAPGCAEITDEVRATARAGRSPCCSTARCSRDDEMIAAGPRQQDGCGWDTADSGSGRIAGAPSASLPAQNLRPSQRPDPMLLGGSPEREGGRARPASRWRTMEWRSGS